MKKYKLTDEYIEFYHIKLFRIRALQDFGVVKKGVLGGFVESERNLSHEGDCWIFDDARVFGNAWVSGNARVSDDARLYGNSLASQDAVISGNAIVSGGSCVFGDISLTGTTKWSLTRSETPDVYFFNSGLTIKDVTIQTPEDFIRAFPEWCI